MKTFVKRLITFLIIGTVAASAVYLGGSVIALKIVEGKIFDGRKSDPETLTTNPLFIVQKTQPDYPILQEREQLTFDYNDVTLTGYLYKADNPKGLVLASHGAYSLADGDNAQYQSYFVQNGWDVFALDLLSCGRSGGKSMISMYESRYCIDASIDYLRTIDEVKELPLCLIGHSWGAYGSIIASGDKENISAVASFAAYDKPSELMLTTAMKYVNASMVVGKPGLDFALAVTGKKEAFNSASKVIKKNKDTNYIVVHGTEDDMVPLKNYSVYSHVANNKKLTHVTAVKLEGYGHNGLWRDFESQQIVNEMEQKFTDLFKQYPKKVPEDKYQELINQVNKEESSMLNLMLLGQINEIFENSVKNPQ